MKNLFLVLIMLLTFNHVNAQTTTKNLIPNKNLIPQEIDYDGKPDLQYEMKNKIIVLDYWNESINDKTMAIRMKFKNKEVVLLMQSKNLTKAKRVYSNNEFTVTFFNIIYGECLEGAQSLTGKLLIESKTEQNTVSFKGYDSFYYNQNCR